MKKRINMIFAVVVSLMMIFSFAACGASDDEVQTSKQGKNTIQEDAQHAETKTEDGVVKVDIPTRHFIGTWTADSPKAEYLYGNLKITLNKDNTWTGIITDENLHGTWEERDFGVHLYDEVELWECDLFYTENENFVLNEDGLKVVLTRH